MIIFQHLLLTAPLYADVVWPALVLEQRILSVIPITAGLIVEWAALCFGGFGLSWKKAVVVDVVMNAVSTGVGIVLIPALGFAWEFFPGIVLYKVFNVGSGQTRVAVDPLQFFANGGTKV